ncbi:hypothetical protein V8G54_021583 [Vigna mungo]|uniref:Uncharacterized protein n=1 Tax=Vigna mungo TaxID=3915 RepID=A0AAQ3RVX1_VIGMU
MPRFTFHIQPNFVGKPVSAPSRSTPSNTADIIVNHDNLFHSINGVGPVSDVQPFVAGYRFGSVTGSVTSKNQIRIQLEFEVNLNFGANLGEIVELAARQVEELAKIVLRGFDLDELENEGATHADVIAAWEEVATDEGFKDTGLATALAADNGHLREVDGGVAPYAAEDVLELIHQRDQRRTQRSGGSAYRHRHIEPFSRLGGDDGERPEGLRRDACVPARCGSEGGEGLCRGVSLPEAILVKTHLSQQQVLATIRGLKLMKFLDGYVPPPKSMSSDNATTSLNPAQVEYDQQDQSNPNKIVDVISVVTVDFVAMSPSSEDSLEHLFRLTTPLSSSIVPNFTSTCSILLRVSIKKINYMPVSTDNSSALVFQEGEHNPSRKLTGAMPYMVVLLALQTDHPSLPSNVEPTSFDTAGLSTMFNEFLKWYEDSRIPYIFCWSHSWTLGS